jgi:GAF domain-containing protein
MPAPKSPEAVELAPFQPPLTQAERAARSLAEKRPVPASFELELLASALDEAAALTTVAAAFVPRFADWGFIYLVDGAGIPRRVKVAHADPSRAALAARFDDAAPSPGSAPLTTQAIRDGNPRLVREVTPEVLRWASSDEQHLALLAQVAPHSMLALPLHARGRVIGGITLMRSAQAQRLSEQDLVAAAQLTGPAALALDDARAVAAERLARERLAAQSDLDRRARREAERGLLRLRRLEAAAVSLASSLPPESIGRLVFEDGLADLEAKTGTLAIAKGEGELVIAYARGWPEEALASWKSFRADARSLVAEAFRTRTPIWIDSLEALARAYPSVVELPRLRGEQAWAAVPLVADGRALGAVGLGFGSTRHLLDEDREYVVALVALAAQALARTPTVR